MSILSVTTVYFLSGTFIHVKHRSKDVIGDIDSLLHFIDITTESTGKSDQVLLLSSPLDDITRHAWKVSQIRQFRITDLGISIEFCPNCYKTHTPQHRSFNLFIKSSEINICVEFLCRKVKARAVAESLDNYITIYKIQDHNCPTPDPPTTPPPPPLPMKPNSDRPPVPARIHPRFGYLNGPSAEPCAVQPYPRMKESPSTRLRNLVSPYKITSRIVINNDGSVSHESTVLGHLGGMMDRSPMVPMRKSKKAKALNLRAKKSTEKHQDLQNSISLLPPKNVPRRRCPSSVLTPTDELDDSHGDYINVKSINDSDEDYENDWCTSAPSDPVQLHKPLSYIEPVSSKENLVTDDDANGDYVDVPEVVDSLNTSLDYVNIPDSLNVTDCSNALDSSASATLDSSTVNTLDSSTSLAHSDLPIQEVESDSDIMDSDYINVTEILKEINPPIPLASPTRAVTNTALARPVIKKRTLRSMNSKSNLGVSKPVPTTKPKVITPSDASLSKPVSGVPSPKPRRLSSKSSAVSFELPSTGIPSNLKSVSLKSSEQASNASHLLPDKASTVTSTNNRPPPKVSPKPSKRHQTTVSRPQWQEDQQQQPIKRHQTEISRMSQQQQHQQQQQGQLQLQQHQESQEQHHLQKQQQQQLQKQHQALQEQQLQQHLQKQQGLQKQKQHQELPEQQLQQHLQKQQQQQLQRHPQRQHQALQEQQLQQHLQKQQQLQKQKQHQELPEQQLQTHQQHHQQQLHEQEQTQKNKQQQQPKIQQLQQHLQRQLQMNQQYPQQQLQSEQQHPQKQEELLKNQQQQQHLQQQQIQQERQQQLQKQEELLKSKQQQQQLQQQQMQHLKGQQQELQKNQQHQQSRQQYQQQSQPNTTSKNTEITKKLKIPPSTPRRTTSLSSNETELGKGISNLTVSHTANSLQHKPEQYVSTPSISDTAHGSITNQTVNQTKRKKKVPLPTPKARSQSPEGTYIILIQVTYNTYSYCM